MTTVQRTTPGQEWVKGVHETKKQWLDALARPSFDSVELYDIWTRHQQYLADEAEYKALYDEQREIYLAEYHQVYDRVVAELTPLSKENVAAMCGYGGIRVPKHLTKTDLIRGRASDVARREVENEHDRVQRIWRERKAAQGAPHDRKEPTP